MTETPLKHPGVWFPPPLVYLAPFALAFWSNRRVPFLIVTGRKGGSAMAVAAVNALASEAE